MPKLCEFENCRKQASYGYFFQKAERCKDHKEDRKSQYRICRCGNAQPRYGLPTDKKPTCCSKCKNNNMINMLDKKCKEDNCDKQPNFNYEGEKKGLYCSKHKKLNMINIKKKRCKENGCYTQANFNYEGKKTGLYCTKHAKENMIDIKNRKCKCGKHRPTYGLPTDTKATCCLKCKTYEMINIVSKKCKCGKHRPCFGLPSDTKVTCCSKCKTDKMVDLKNQKCKCGKNPTFGLPSDIKATCCLNCKTYEMCNIKDKRCKNCADWPDFQQANKKYKNYCARCFQRLFPKDPLTFQIKSKTKEVAVRDYINTIFDGFQHDKCLFTGGCDCTHRRRIDHRKLIGNTLLCIETDEKQHKRYNKKDEKDRYEDLYMVFSGKWIFIRFNPDKYTNKKGVRKNPTIARRLFKLKEEMEKQIKRIENEENKELVEISYLYYNGFD